MTDEQCEKAAPYAALVHALEGLDYFSTITEEGWWQRAFVLAEVSADVDHARRILDAFLRTPRYDERGNLLTSVPSVIELRVFASSISAAATAELPRPCQLCAPNGGTHKIVKRNGVELTARCGCARGEALRKADEANRG